jgi:secretion/DNA translocation related CpaE-like protein
MASRTTISKYPDAAQTRPLMVVDDSELLDELLRLAAVAAVQCDVAPDPASARARFATAPFVLVGVGLAQACARARLPRRPGVVLVSSDASGAPPWELAEILGAEHIAVLPAAEPWLVERFLDMVGDHTSGGLPESTLPRGRTVAVLGGRGGAGASVFAAALTVTAARQGFRALLVDGDPLGGGVDLVLGWESLAGPRWPALARACADVGPATPIGPLPSRGDLTVLSWDRDGGLTVPTEAMAAALDSGGEAHDLVVVDLPRRIDDACGLALGAADRALLLVPAELRACAAAARVAAAASVHTETLAVVVRGPAPGGLKAPEIARALDLPLAGWLRVEPKLAYALERGEPPAGTGKGPLAQLCQRILADLNLRDRPVAA